MLILPAEADEALVGTAVDRITKVVEAGGGSIGQLDRWGRRRFAYEIAHQHEGYYVVLRFRADPAVQPELDRVLNIADEVIRHKILQLPDAALATPEEPQESKGPTETAKAPEPPVADATETADHTTASPAPA
jgi:small subunit ribosomal protein S6